MQIISARIHFLRLVEIYIANSQIIGGIIKLIRKVVQVLTNYHSKLLNVDKLTTNPKVFCKEFKVI